MLSREDILEQMRERVHHPAGTRELLQLLKIPREERASFRRHLKSLAADGHLIQIRGQRFGLPEKMDLKLIEPLRELFKDEVRLIGRELHVPEEILGRHPFPGPGLAVRILGDITEEKIRLVQAADRILDEELRLAELYHSVWQAFPVLLPVSTVGVMGDERTYERVVAIRAVTSVDGMTADWARLPHDLLARVSARIVSEIRGINRVVYDISSKPPSTIEWE